MAFDRGGQRDHLDVDVAHVPVGAHLDAFLASQLTGLARFGQRRSHAEQQALAQHLEQVQRRLAGRQLEEGAGLTARLHDAQVAVDDHAGRREAGHEDARGLALDPHALAGQRQLLATERRLGRPGIRRVEVQIHAAERRLAQKDPLLLLEHLEKLVVRSDSTRRGPA